MKPFNKTITAYKMFRTLKQHPGKLFSLFISKTNPVPVGVWVLAQHIPTKGYAPRPGWHAGLKPVAPHLMCKDGTMPKDRVWAEVEIPADKDWQPVADKQRTKDIRNEVPVGGYYRFPRSQSQGFEWVVSGAIRVKRVLSQEEVNKLV
jgi:hypothetical protein